MIVLILLYAFMGVVFIASQRQGQAFIASVDKAFVWGSCFLVIGCCLNAFAYMA
jgi:hypothetical protein